MTLRRLSLLLISTPVLCAAQVPVANAIGDSGWRTHAGNPQHTNISQTSAQAMRGILWSTPVDLAPQYSGSSLLMHYASPLATKQNTVVVAVKTGSYDGFKFEGRSANDGSLVWTENTDYSLPPHNWTPTCEGTITEDNAFYYPGAGGTIYKRASADSPTSTVTQLCFYGLANYQSDPTTYNANIKICTPISSDSDGNLLFGFEVFGPTGVGLSSGVARIAADGTGSWISGTTLTNDGGAGIPQTNCAPAFSNDESTAYIAIHGANQQLAYLCAFDASTLARTNSVRLLVPGTGTGCYTLDDGTSTPTVGPDGDVYFGAWYFNAYRGFMLHYDSTLTTTKAPGAFGWDITPSIIPTSMIPSYTGTSSYLLLQKYNNYIEGGFGGYNMVAVLDPNDTMIDPVSGATVMKEIWTKLGPTPDPRGGFIEWCVNTTAIDPSTKSAIVNSEDGKCYRWDLVTNTFSETMTLTSGLGEAYTSTIIGPDGLCYAMSNATVYAIWDQVTPATLTCDKTSVVGGDPCTATLDLSDVATGPGARVFLSSDDSHVQLPAYVDVPAGQNSVAIPVQTTEAPFLQNATITASRYGHTATYLLKVRPVPTLDSVYFENNITIGSMTVKGYVKLTGGAPLGGDDVSLSSNTNKVVVPSSALVLEGNAQRGFNAQTNPVGAITIGTVSATFAAVTKTATLTVYPGGLSNLIVGPAVVEAGTPALGTIKLTAAAPPGGLDVEITANSAAVQVPSIVHVPAGNSQQQFPILTTLVGRRTIVTVRAKLGNTFRFATLTVTPGGIIDGGGR